MSSKPSITRSWTLLGDNIDGEAICDTFGYSVSLSSNGETVAVGSIQNDDNGSDSGHVRVYEWTSNSEWIQLGDDIDGEAEDDFSGVSVSLSDNGRAVAIGANGNDNINGQSSGHVRVYKLENSAWIQSGNDIDGEAKYDGSGRSVSLSDNGEAVAIGAPGNDGNGTRSGRVRVYSYNGTSNSWDPLGDAFDGEAALDQSGSSVSLSSNGETVAIGANDHDGSSGHVRVYEWTSNSVWKQLGDDIDGEAIGDQSGYYVSLSSNGRAVAIGSPFNDGNGPDSGHVRVYELNESGSVSWIQLGDDIDGEAGGDGSGFTGDRSGWSVSLSDNGKTVAIGAPNNRGINNEYYSGHARVYRFNESGNWIQLGTDIGDGEAYYDESGYSVSLSSNGETVAISTMGFGSSRGVVRVYKW